MDASRDKGGPTAKKGREGNHMSDVREQRMKNATLFPILRSEHPSETFHPTRPRLLGFLRRTPLLLVSHFHIHYWLMLQYTRAFRRGEFEDWTRPNGTERMQGLAVRD